MTRKARQTKAERIFKATYFESLHHVRYWGIDYDAKHFGQSVIGWNSLATNDDDTVSTRTLNAVEKLAKSELKTVNLSEELDVIDKTKADECRQALSMVLVTVENVRKNLEEFRRI